MSKRDTIVTAQEVIAALGLEEKFLLSLHRERIIPTKFGESYDAQTVERIRVCQTLHVELGVNFAGLEVALQLLETMHAQRAQFREVLHWLRTQLDDKDAP